MPAVRASLLVLPAHQAPSIASLEVMLGSEGPFLYGARLLTSRLWTASSARTPVRPSIAHLP